MKKFALLFALVFVAGVAGAQEQPAKPAEKAAAPAQTVTKAPALKTHQMVAEVVSFDATKHTITLKGEKENTTSPVEGKGLAHLKTLKAGEKVTVTCRDNDKGEHQAVTEIVPVKAAPAKK